LTDAGDIGANGLGGGLRFEPGNGLARIALIGEPKERNVVLRRTDLVDLRVRQQISEDA
jgi:hypothetical protein